MIPLLIAGAVLWLVSRATPPVQLVSLPPGSAGISDPTQPLIAPAEPTIPPDLPQAPPMRPRRYLPYPQRMGQTISHAPFFADSGDGEFTLTNPDVTPVYFSTPSSSSGGGGGVGGGGGGSGGGTSGTTGSGHMFQTL